MSRRCISLKIGPNLTWIKTAGCHLYDTAEGPGIVLCANHDRSEEGAMRAFSLQRSHRSLPNVFVQSWRRWMMSWADQLLETARLGSDNLEYLTHDRKGAGSDPCPVVGGHDDDLLRRLMLALELDPYELALSDPALLRHLRRRCALCQSREDCASDLARASAGQACQGQDDWRDYCENALALEMLVALRSRSKAALNYQRPPYIA
jgi:hypothetical protein